MKQLDHLPVKAEEEEEAICHKKETMQTHFNRPLDDSEVCHAMLLIMPPRMHFFTLSTMQTRV
jgi:hypothetical protein